MPISSYTCLCITISKGKIHSRQIFCFLLFAYFQMVSLSATSVQLKHLSSTIRLISTHRPVSKTTFNLSVLETLPQQCRDFKEFKQILSQMILTGSIKDTFAAKRLLQFSTNDLPFIHVDYSYQIFNAIENPEASIYNIMMMAYVRRSYPHRAIHFYKLMLYRNVCPNVYTYPFLVEACADRQANSEGEQMHNHILKLGFDSDVHVRSILVDMYSEFCMDYHADKVFNEGPMMGSFVWHPYLEGSIEGGNWRRAKYIYNLMPGKDTTALKFMIMFFWRSVGYEMAEYLIKKIPENDTAAWSELIYCLQTTYNERYEEALVVFMRTHAYGMTIDELVVENVLLCCTNFAGIRDTEMGKLVHSLIVKMGFESDVELHNSLIRMYSTMYSRSVELHSSKKRECAMYSAQKLFNEACWLHESSWTTYLECGFGFDENANVLFESMPTKDVESCTLKIAYYSTYGCFFESLALFQEMMRSGYRVDEITLCHIIEYLPSHFDALDLGKCIHAYLIKNAYDLSLRGGLRGGLLCDALQRMYGKRKMRKIRNIGERGFY